nr:olfactory receptor 7 [Gregopimpla kuwanae]
MLVASASTSTNPKKPLNKTYESDIKRSIQYSRWFLNILGVWPMISKSASTPQKIFSKIIIVFCFIALDFILVPVSLDTILREKNALVKLTRFLGPISASLSSVTKYVFLLIRCKNIRLCMEHMESDWMTVEKENERAIMISNVNVGRKITINACALIYTGITFWLSISPLLMATKINERNETIRPLPHPGYDLFVNTQKSPTYEIIYFTICATGLLRYTVTMTACNFAAMIVSHACGQIQIVMARLECLFDEIEGEKNNDVLQGRISSIVHCHVRGLRLSTRIDDVLREMCFIEVVTSTLVMCNFTYNIQTGFQNNQTVLIMVNFLLLISYILNLFIFCYIGELLKEQYYEVGKSTYFIDWQKFPGKSGLAVVLIIAMANVPRKITAGQMMELSMDTFGLIMRTSAAYLNMMIAMTD